MVKGNAQLTVSAFCGSGPFHTSATVFPGPTDWSIEWVEAQDTLDINSWNCNSHPTATDMMWTEKSLTNQKYL